MTEPSKDELKLDQRLGAALHQVEVPSDLCGRIATRLQLAAHEEKAISLSDSSMQSPSMDDLATISSANLSNSSGIWYRRRFIQGITAAASIGAVAFTYRQLMRPLSQNWLLDCSTALRGQVNSPGIQLLPVTATLMSTPTLTSFRKQTRGLTWTDFCELNPPANANRATAFLVGNNMWAFELVVPRRVEGLSEQLTTLSSHSIAAMALADSVLFLSGSDLAKYILTSQAI